MSVMYLGDEERSILRRIAEALERKPENRFIFIGVPNNMSQAEWTRLTQNLQRVLNDEVDKT